MSKFFTPFRHIIKNFLIRKQFTTNRITCFTQYYQKLFINSAKIQIIKIFPIVFPSSILNCSLVIFNRTPTDFVKNAYEFEKEISEIINKAEELIVKGQHEDAQKMLKSALQLCYDKEIYGNISAIYELLASIAFREGAILEAENMIVEFIEKLIQLGYPETHNSIVRFKLKLSRLYQTVGNNEMAELGYKECITIQEDKIYKSNGNLDDASNVLLCNALFWYARLMQETGELRKAKIYYRKTLDRIRHSKTITPEQTMVVIYFLADVFNKLGDMDSALSYLYQGLEIGINETPDNPDTSLYVLKIGLLHLAKGLYDNARYWCEAAMILANGNKEICDEAQQCLDQIAKFQEKKSI